MSKLIAFFLFIVISINLNSQEISQLFIEKSIRDGNTYRQFSVPYPTDSFEQTDFSHLWVKTDPRHVLGFIGSKYRRIRVAIQSVIRHPGDQQRYRVYGKTMVGTNKCDFQGEINVTSIRKIQNSEMPDKKCGALLFDYIFYEDPKQNHVGWFNGKGITYWYENEQGEIMYDDLLLVDGFTNNEFVGIWTAYGKVKGKSCNWGDYRIPFSGDLDQGAGEFFPSDQYLSNGWDSYRAAKISDNEKEQKAAQLIENRKWWIP